MKNLLFILRRLVTLLLVFVFTCQLSYAQESEYVRFIDSLKNELDRATNDTIRVGLMLDLADAIYDEKEWTVYNQRAFDLSEMYLPKSSGRNKTFFISAKGFALSNMGYLADEHGKRAEALDYYQQGLKLHVSVNNRRGLASGYNNIGSIFYEQGDLDRALAYYLKSAKIKEEDGMVQSLGLAYLNIGSVYQERNEEEEALNYYRKSQYLHEQVNNRSGMANALNNIGAIYNYLEKYDSALVYLRQSLQLYVEIKDLIGQAWELGNIGDVLGNMEVYDSAYFYNMHAMEIGNRTHHLNVIKAVHENLVKILPKMGRHKEALYHYQQYNILKDSVLNIDTQKEIVTAQLNFEHEKETLVMEQNAQIADEKAAKQQLTIYFSIGGLLVLIVFSYLILRRYQTTKRQKELIETQKKEVEVQKHLIEEAHTEITDSINYAKRLQDAILPSLDEVNKYLPNNFILFKPKDVVSGDFYWFEQLNGTAYLAVADCTGHGVPGAMVSVVCSNALNRSVKEFGITEPAKILDKTRELVIETFAKSGGDVQDGMDIALCAFKDNMVTYSGANNPLWIVRKTDLITEEQKQEKSTVTDSGLSLIEYKSNKQPIGLYTEIKAFTQQEIELHSGDSLYLFTDGFADQFGGEKGKKFMYKPFKRFLIGLHTQAMTDRAQLISDSFESWKGELEQIDDVCVVGVKIE